MRPFRVNLATSAVFGATSPAFSSSAAGSTAVFGPGLRGGPTELEYARGFTMQGNFGGDYPAGRFNCLVSNVPEMPMFVVAASAMVASTGSVMFNMTQMNARYADFQFIPASTSSNGFVTVVLQEKSLGI